MKKGWLLLVLCPFLFCACYKPDREHVYTLDPAALKYIQLRLDQYFIFKDSASGQTDSVVVTGSSLSSESFTYSSWFSNTPISAKREVYNLTLTRKAPRGDSAWLQASAKGDFTNQVSLVQNGGASVFFYPASCFYCSNIFVLSSLTIEGETYRDVVVVEDVMVADCRCTYYWAPGVGILKINRTDAAVSVTSQTTQTFTLLRHN